MKTKHENRKRQSILMHFANEKLESFELLRLKGGEDPPPVNPPILPPPPPLNKN
ncbi:MAG TPA: hypothetical protein PKK00_05070 [Bacteroidales bacterium]|nr:hypothetical protein [Bacteroidales bacterium]HPS16730.1 hypothetical protein [Bacteroidales bacterium]